MDGVFGTRTMSIEEPPNDHVEAQARPRTMSFGTAQAPQAQGKRE
jgi:hypothetical protein